MLMKHLPTHHDDLRSAQLHMHSVELFTVEQQCTVYDTTVTQSPMLLHAT